jgi:hypothetical protein
MTKVKRITAIVRDRALHDCKVLFDETGDELDVRKKLKFFRKSVLKDHLKKHHGRYQIRVRPAVISEQEQAHVAKGDQQ